MIKRMALMLIVVTVVVATLGTVKYQQVQAAIAQGASFQPPPEAITTIVVEEARWDSTLNAIGTVTAVNGVTVSADLPGIVEQIAFESGHAVKKGDVLVSLDTRQERAQLKAAIAQRERATLQLDRIEGLRHKRVSSQSELDDVRTAFTQADARVGEIEATIERKTVRAPFTGILGIRQINLGQYLSPGDPIVHLQSLQPIYIDFTVPQQQVDMLGVGTTVTVVPDGRSPDGGRITMSGRVSAIDSLVDPTTRNVQVRAELDNPDGALRPGMFVEARVQTGESKSVVTLPASAVAYAPYGNSIFVVEELQAPGGATYLGARQQFVELGPSRGDQVAVLSGVQPGEQVATSGVFKLYNGAAVHVNNDVQPGNDPAPVPENS